MDAENFDLHVTQSTDPWLIEFYRHDCPHCIALAPTVEKLADYFEGEVRVGHVDVEVESNKPLLKFFHIEYCPVI